MITSRFEMRVLLSALAASVFLTGCGVFVTMRADSPEFNKDSAKTDKEGLNGEYADMLVRKFSLMALFAEVAYRRDLEVEIRSRTSSCIASLTDHESQFGMPGSKRYVKDFSVEDDHWRRWDGNGNASVKPCVSRSGLFYETYVFGRAGGPIEEAVISFRGTESGFRSGLRDWAANLSALFGFEPKQYRVARERLLDLINALKQENGDIKIYAVGHSLGGGLAQQLGYLSREVYEVYTFNTSPVTNWTYLRLAKAVDNEYPTIYRVFHIGEVLEKVRFVSTAFTRTRFGRYDIGFQENEKSNFEGHSMKLIACGLLQSASTGGQDVLSHGFSRALAAPVFEEVGGVCSGWSPGT